MSGFRQGKQYETLKNLFRWPKIIRLLETSAYKSRNAFHCPREVWIPFLMIYFSYDQQHNRQRQDKETKAWNNQMGNRPLGNSQRATHPLGHFLQAKAVKSHSWEKKILWFVVTSFCGILPHASIRGNSSPCAKNPFLEGC